MIWIYNILLTLTAPLWVPWMLLRANRRNEKVNWKERTGTYNLDLGKDTARIFFHAVSVGEVVAALPILQEIRKQWPEAKVVLSVTTSSGHQTAREKAEGLYDELVYFPIDVARFTVNALFTVRPHVVAIMETELWMNFLSTAKDFHCATLLINGRISDRSFPRSRKLRFFYQPLLENVDQCLMQTEVDRTRILELGAKSAEVYGNCKFDQAAESRSASGNEWRSKLGIPLDAFVVVVGSTRGEEEEIFVTEALQQLSRDVVVVHAPRHIERTDEILKLRSAKGLSTAKRSLGESGDYIMLDTYGELDHVYSVADLVVIGGGFADLGGQNLIQPLALGKPVLHGPHMQNFRDVTEMADREGAAISCASPSELAQQIEKVANDSQLRSKMGQAAKQLVDRQIGASRRYAEAIVSAGKVEFERRAELKARKEANAKG